IVNDHVKGGWDRVVTDIERIRNDKTLGSKTIRDVIDSVERRYRNEDGSPADKNTFASEVIATMAERGIRTGTIERIMAAVRAFLRQPFPNLLPHLNERDLHGLLRASQDFIRSNRELPADHGERVRALAFNRQAVSEFLRGEPIAEAGADALAPKAGERAGF